MSTVYFLGIDPGQTGAVVALTPSGAVHNLISFTDHKEHWPRYLASFLDSFRPSHIEICLEKVHAMPKQGVSSTFTFGKNYGIVQGVLYALGHIFASVPPRVWTKALWTSSEGTSKTKSNHTATELWGITPFIRSKRCTKPDQGLIDAALIAEYSRRLFFMKVPPKS